jgi:hypothetical protein
VRLSIRAEAIEEITDAEGEEESTDAEGEEDITDAEGGEEITDAEGEEESTDAEGEVDTGKEKPGRLAEAIEETEEISDVGEDTGRETVVAVCGGEQREVRGGIGEACVVLEVARQVLNLLALLVLKYRY